MGSELSENDEVIIDKQFIGTIKGLRLNLDFSSTALQTDIKSIKKAARQGVVEELKKRINDIVKENIESAALQLKEAEELVQTTGMPSGIPTPPESVLENLL